MYVRYRAVEDSVSSVLVNNVRLREDCGASIKPDMSSWAHSQWKWPHSRGDGCINMGGHVTRNMADRKQNTLLAPLPSTHRLSSCISLFPFMWCVPREKQKGDGKDHAEILKNRRTACSMYVKQYCALFVHVQNIGRGHMDCTLTVYTVQQRKD